ncbi:MAG: HsdR family type I site-specific deoxyribonuclease, partial [Actinomycetota bacterium]
FHRMLVDGVQVERPAEGGGVRGEIVRLVDFEDAETNDWLALNQYTVVEHSNRRADVVVFLNGLPVALFELKSALDEDADIWMAHRQIQTYKQEIPSLFTNNEVLVISDGVDARMGSLTGEKEWFLPWRTIEGDALAPAAANKLEVLTRGVFEKEHFLDLLRHFIVFEVDGADIAKKIGSYHQFHATRKAVEQAVLASRQEGDRRGGVVWHTQGSGKSLTMTFYAGKLAVHPALDNPTIVVLTDRNDLDGQLFGVFARCKDILRQTPEQADDRADLRRLLTRASGGVIFTTIQKFLPEEKDDSAPTLSDRRNVVVIADEAHRSQYDFIDGYARRIREALPQATFIGFTGTPLETDDRNTRSVFGDYIDVYDIQQAVEDGATVPIYYESRLAKLDIDPDALPRIDPEFEEATEGEEIARKERLKTKWAALEAVVGSPKRLSLIARDLVDHFDRRQEAMVGKAMVVCMSRRICVDLYDEIAKLRPEWASDDDLAGELKVVMTGSASDDPEWQRHIRNKVRRDELAKRFKDASDPFKVVLVRDMWLTGFDVPSLHTMYLDKPMRGHTLMQAIARVNRVFRDKPGGLVVDYLGIADDLKKALAIYAGSGGRGEPTVDQDEAVAVMLEKFEICRDLFHGFDYSDFLVAESIEQLRILAAAQEHILQQEEGRERFIRAVVELSRAFAIATPREEALETRDDVIFFQHVKVALVKTERGEHRPEEQLDHAIRQIVSAAIAPEGVVDIFEAAGLDKPDISILSEEFLAEVRDLPHRNLAVEVLQRLLNDELKVRAQRHLVQSRKFSEMLGETVDRYKARAITTAQVIEELIEIARQVREAGRRGEELDLTDDEVAFYDALAANESAMEVLGDETLRDLARKLADTVRQNATIDWTVKESARANLRSLVRRLLAKYGYPPDKREEATRTVLEQAELLGYEWVAEVPAAREAVASGEPFRRLSLDEAKPYENSIPLYSLEVAAGIFGFAQEVEMEEQPEAWVAAEGLTPRKGLFVARVEGESMNKRIPSGSYCVFRHPVEGSRQGRVVLVESREIEDPDHGGKYTVKIYESEKSEGPDGEWKHERIRLLPASSEPGYSSIELASAASDLRVVAELVRVLPTDS